MSSVRTSLCSTLDLLYCLTCIHPFYLSCMRVFDAWPQWWLSSYAETLNKLMKTWKSHGNPNFHLHFQRKDHWEEDAYSKGKQVCEHQASFLMQARGHWKNSLCPCADDFQKSRRSWKDQVGYKVSLSSSSTLPLRSSVKLSHISWTYVI